MGVLKAEETKDYLILGELALDGSLIAVNGISPAAIGANQRNYKIICPEKTDMKQLGRLI
jgi:magnesium chelatase family protein